MDPTSDVRNFLYRNPQYYELVYPEPSGATPRMCERLFERYLPNRPQSILDIGCGTGRDLGVLSRSCPECWGVDALPEMLAYAGRQYPGLHLVQGDMRSVRLGRTFDVVMCMGSAFMYALTDEDIRRTLDTFAAHCHEGTLLILDINNAAAYLGGGFQETVRYAFETPDFRATGVAVHTLDRRRQLLVRERTWTIEGREPVVDFCRYRLHFPADLEHRLAEAGLDVAGMFDNKRLHETDLSGQRLYVAAIRKPAT